MTDALVERGAAPGAGFEESDQDAGLEDEMEAGFEDEMEAGFEDEMDRMLPGQAHSAARTLELVTGSRRPSETSPRRSSTQPTQGHALELRELVPPSSFLSTSAPTGDAARETTAIFTVPDPLNDSRTSSKACSLLLSRLQSLVPHDCMAVYLRFGDVIKPQSIEGAMRDAFSLADSADGEGLSGWVTHSGRPIGERESYR